MESGSKEGLTKLSEYYIIKVRRDDVTLEYQRYGRNKSTLVNKTYIESGKFRRKFDSATDNPELNKALYNAAKAALKHRSGTELEDMYWFNGKTGEEIYSVLDSTEERAVVYTDKIKSILLANSGNEIIALHTHPNSMPPSIEDLNSCFQHGYKCGFIACHNGKIFRYSSTEYVNKKLYDLYLGEYLDRGLTEFDAQIRTLNKIKENHAVDFEEVV